MNDSKLTESHPVPVREPSAHRRLAAISLVVATSLLLGYAQHRARLTWGFDVTEPWTRAGLLSLGSLLVPFAMVLLFMRRWRKSWADYGLDRRMPVWKIGLYGIAGAAAIHFSFRYALGPLIHRLAPQSPDVSHLNSLPGNLPGLILALVLVWITAAVIEELIFRGFLLNEVASVIGGRRGWIISAVVTGVAFGLAHLYQGTSGVLLTGTIGILMGAFYLLTGRSLWPLILAHGLVDTYGLIQIYLMA